LQPPLGLRFQFGQLAEFAQETRVQQIRLLHVAKEGQLPFGRFEAIVAFCSGDLCCPRSGAAICPHSEKWSR